MYGYTLSDSELTVIIRTSKSGIEGIYKSPSQEVADFDIHVTLIEPGGFDTDGWGDAAKHSTSIAACDPIREKRA